jgi:hypothetical protein
VARVALSSFNYTMDSHANYTSFYVMLALNRSRPSLFFMHTDMRHLYNHLTTHCKTMMMIQLMVTK